jgi:hypothetical protein
MKLQSSRADREYEIANDLRKTHHVVMQSGYGELAA